MSSKPPPDLRFNPPPSWPAPPQGWTPPPGWAPDPSWPPPPVGWQLWIADAAVPARPGANGQLIRDYQDRLDIAVATRAPGHAPTNPVAQAPEKTVQPPGNPAWQQPGPRGRHAATLPPPAPAWHQPPQPGQQFAPPWQGAAGAGPSRVPDTVSPPGRHGFAPSRGGRRRRVMIGGSAALLLAVAVGTALALTLPGGSKLSPGSGTSAAAAGPPLPPAEVLVLGSELTLINAATHAVEKQLPIQTSNSASGETGGTQMAFARTSRGLIAYVVSGGGVVAVDVSAGTAAKPIKVIGGAAAIAASPDGTTVYVANWVFHPPSSRSGYVTPIDTATNTAGHPIPVGATADQVAFAPNGKTAYVVSSMDNTVTPINVATGRPGPPISVGTRPGAIVFTADSKTAYIASPGTITPIDVATGTAETAIPVGGALAITPDGKTLYALSGDSVTPIDTATNILSTPVSLSSTHRTWLELLMAPNGKTLYAMDQQGDLTPVDIQTNTVEPTANAGYAIDMAITPDGKTIYLTDPVDNLVTPYDTATRTMGKQIDLAGSNPDVSVVYWAAVAP
jgi:DNA-binding beta-propeller fold protein YncE